MIIKDRWPNTSPTSRIHYHIKTDLLLTDAWLFDLNFLASGLATGCSYIANLLDRWHITRKKEANSPLPYNMEFYLVNADHVCLKKKKTCAHRQFERNTMNETLCYPEAAAWSNPRLKLGHKRILKRGTCCYQLGFGGRWQRSRVDRSSQACNLMK